MENTVKHEPTSAHGTPHLRDHHAAEETAEREPEIVANHQHLALSRLGDVIVSTVRLAERSWRIHRFETMVIGASDYDEYCAAWMTEQQATDGHARVVAALRAGEALPSLHGAPDDHRTAALVDQASYMRSALETIREIAARVEASSAGADRRFADIAIMASRGLGGRVDEVGDFAAQMTASLTNRVLELQTTVARLRATAADRDRDVARLASVVVAVEGEIDQWAVESEAAGPAPASHYQNRVRDVIAERMDRPLPLFSAPLNLRVRHISTPVHSEPHWQIRDARDETTWHDLTALTECGESDCVTAADHDGDCTVLFSTAWASGCGHFGPNELVLVRLPAVSR